MKTLEPGKIYMVKIKGKPRKVRRAFKWTEKRFGAILCYVFTSAIQKGVQVLWDPKEKMLTLQGKRLPSSELSIPHYDIEEIEEAV